MCQPDSRFQVLLWLPVPQGTVELRPTDHMRVRFFICDYNLTAYPAPHVQNGFAHFCCHDSTQLRKYDQGFPPYYDIGRNKKWGKMFPLIVAVLTALILISCFPPSQERHHWLIFVGICISVAKFDANDGFILYIPY